MLEGGGGMTMEGEKGGGEGTWEVESAGLLWGGALLGGGGGGGRGGDDAALEGTGTGLLGWGGGLGEGRGVLLGGAAGDSGGGDGSSAAAAFTVRVCVELASAAVETVVTVPRVDVLPALIGPTSGSHAPAPPMGPPSWAITVGRELR